MAMSTNSGSRKESLRRALLSYLYAPGYKDISLFSPTYSENILQYIIPNLETYTLISGDADKLGSFNQTYGEKQGDIALYHTLSHIHSRLSSFDPNVISLRVNMGDEVHYVYPNHSEEECQSTIVAIQDSLEHLVHYYPDQYLRMSFGVADSKGKTFPEVVSQANNRLACDKEVKSFDTKKELQRQLIFGWDKYFNLGRISINNIEFPKKSMELREKFADLIENMEHTINQTHEKKSSETEQLYSAAKGDSAIAYINHQAIHSYLMTGIDNGVKEDELKILFDSLCRNRHTHLLTKEYLEKQLLTKLESQRKNYHVEYAICRFHISGLKQSNYQNGMDFTDLSLGLVANSIKSASGLAFNEKTLSIYRDDNFIIDANGGNFIIISPVENIKGNTLFTEIPNSNSSIESSTPSHPSSPFTNLREQVASINNTFHILSRKSITSSDKNIERCIQETTMACKRETAAYHDTPQEELLYLAFSEPIQNFLETHPSQNSKNLFCDIAMATFSHFYQAEKNRTIQSDR